MGACTISILYAVARTIQKKEPRRIDDCKDPQLGLIFVVAYTIAMTILSAWHIDVVPLLACIVHIGLYYYYYYDKEHKEHKV